MSFCKAISCKTFNLLPYFLNELAGMSLFLRLFIELLLYFSEFGLASEFSAHASSEHIAFRQAQPCKNMRHPNHIFLIHHNAISFGHDFMQNRMRFFALFFVNMPLNECTHHATSGYARSNYAACRNQC